MGETDLLRAAMRIRNLGDRISCMLLTIPFFPEDRVTPLKPKHTQNIENGPARTSRLKKPSWGSVCGRAVDVFMPGEFSHPVVNLLSDGCPWESRTRYRGNLTINQDYLTINPPENP